VVEVHSDDEGRAELWIPASGRYRLRFAAEGFPTVLLEGVDLKAETRYRLETDSEPFPFGLETPADAVEVKEIAWSQVVRDGLLESLPLNPLD